MRFSGRKGLGNVLLLPTRLRVIEMDHGDVDCGCRHVELSCCVSRALKHDSVVQSNGCHAIGNILRCSSWSFALTRSYIHHTAEMETRPKLNVEEAFYNGQSLLSNCQTRALFKSMCIRPLRSTGGGRAELRFRRRAVLRGVVCQPMLS